MYIFGLVGVKAEDLPQLYELITIKAGSFCSL
jgi:hypothetical protein